MTLSLADLKPEYVKLIAELREDIRPDSDFARHVKNFLGRYSIQHDYVGTEWHGVERLCYELAKTTGGVMVESPGWYKYGSSTRGDMDGKDWRYVVPDPGTHTNSSAAEPVCVNCHSLLHDGVWTMTNTIFSTFEVEVDSESIIADPDHWTRTFLWEMATAEVLQQDGYDYSAAIEDMKLRLRASHMLARRVAQLKPKVRGAFKLVLGKDAPATPVSVGVSEAVLLPNKVGRHEGHKQHLPYSIITVNPIGLKRDAEYLDDVLLHELVHWVLSTECTRYSHGSEFNDIAAELKIKPENRD